MLLQQRPGLTTICKPGQRRLRVPAVDLQVPKEMTLRWLGLLELDDTHFVRAMSTSPDHEADSYISGASPASDTLHVHWQDCRCLLPSKKHQQLDMGLASTMADHRLLQLPCMIYQP